MSMGQRYASVIKRTAHQVDNPVTRAALDRAASHLQQLEDEAALLRNIAFCAQEVHQAEGDKRAAQAHGGIKAVRQELAQAVQQWEAWTAKREAAAA